MALQIGESALVIVKKITERIYPLWFTSSTKYSENLLTEIDAEQSYRQN
jgi:hypothetical protein